MNLLMPGLAAVSALVALPAIVATTMRRYPGPSDGETGRCYGLDGSSSEICCDDPGFASAACCCNCPCHHRDESVDDQNDTPRDFGQGQGQAHGHHHHLHRHIGSSELHPVNTRRL